MLSACLRMRRLLRQPADGDALAFPLDDAVLEHPVGVLGDVLKEVEGDMSTPENAVTRPSTPNFPFITIVMPIRNERRWIEASLGSALAIDYPAERYEVLAIDGISDDGTREILADLAARHPRLRVVDSPEKRQAFALNRGIRLARGDIIVRMDAHTIYPRDYVRQCVRTLLETQADNVGGICITVPGAPTAMGRAIARALSVGFGVGNAAFRIGAEERRWVDTVPFGCWRKDTLIRLGDFATDLPYAEDDELNARLRRRGGRILLDPAISARYIARPTLPQLARMLWRYG